jgi:Cytochrome C oxidase, cbb3-type, subunit III
MGRATDARSRQRLHGLLAGSVGLSAAVAIALLVSTRDATAGWPWQRKHAIAACGHPGCHRGQCLAPDGWAGNWYWMRSPDQEQRVVMSHYNRYCIRCHGIDGRGVWDIPDVPDFTDPRWQTSRPDPQIVNILMQGRGAVMPSFRGTLSLDEAWGMARYLRTFVPGTEAPRPDVGRSAAQPAKPASVPPSVGSIPPPRPVQ